MVFFFFIIYIIIVVFIPFSFSFHSLCHRESMYVGVGREYEEQQPRRKETRTLVSQADADTRALRVHLVHVIRKIVSYGGDRLTRYVT